ncbi:MAG: T9SS type A sorting domain-containing protein, partial [Bacteroidetes bacterium]|nr:T9SS type A sorting domain-containing protein [Bacteroidota bacterium]
VSVGGIVTGVHAAGYFIQQGTGAWNGLYVYDNAHQPALGDSVLVTGTVSEYYNLTELKTVTSFGIISSGNVQPVPVVVNCEGVNAEENEGVLVTASHVTCVNATISFGMWKIQDNNGDTAKVHNLLYAYTPTQGTMYDVTGPDYYSFNEFRVEPRAASDVVVITGIPVMNTSQDVSLYPNPAVTQLTLTGSKTITRVVITGLNGQVVKEITLNQQDKLEIDISGLQSGQYFVNLYNNTILESVKTFVKR